MPRLRPARLPHPRRLAGLLTTEDLAILALTIRKRWPHAVVFRDDMGNLYVEDGERWVAKLDTSAGTLTEL
jgi:hypothetical protein